MSDLKTMKQQPPDGVSASPLGDENLYVWAGTVFGPDDTPWEGGIFSMRLTFTEQYPDKPPRVRFTSEMVRCLPRPRSTPSRALFTRGIPLLPGRLCGGAGRSVRPVAGHAALRSPRTLRPSAPRSLLCPFCTRPT